MPEFQILSSAALSAKTPLISANICLRALPEGHVIHVLEAPDAGDISALLAELGRVHPHGVRPVAPGQWCVVGDDVLPDDELTRLLDTVKPRAMAVDQSHGRVRLLLEGPKVEEVLAKGTAVDLALSSFAVGQSATTLVGHISVHLTRVNENGFELIVLRGFAESLWDDLILMSAEFS